MEFYADNSIIKDLFDIFCFILGILTTYLDRYSLAKKLFIFEDEKDEKAQNFKKLNDIKNIFNIHGGINNPLIKKINPELPDISTDDMKMNNSKNSTDNNYNSVELNFGDSERKKN